MIGSMVLRMVPDNKYLAQKMMLYRILLLEYWKRNVTSKLRMHAVQI